MGVTTKDYLLKKSIEYALQKAMDEKKIKEWYYNGEFHVTTKMGTFTIRINNTTTAREGKGQNMKERNNEEIELNGITYVRKDSVAQAKPTNTEGMPYVICRGHECGVHAGFLKSHDGNHATLVKSRRLWFWKAKEGISLSAVAKNGIADDVKLPNELDEIWLGDVYEVIPCTQEAMDSIVKAGVREQS